MAVTTTWNVMTSGNLWEYITRMAIRNFESNLVFAKLGNMKQLPAGFNKYTFPTVDESIAAAALTEWTVPTEGAFNLTNVEVTLTQFGWYAKLSDVLLSDAPVDVLLEGSFESSRRTANAFDADIQDVIDAGTNVIYADDTGRATITSTDTITSVMLAKAVNNLKANDAPTYDGGYYASVMHPHVFHDLQQESGTGTYIDLHKYDTPEALFAGEAGALFGARILVSSNVQFYVDGWATTTDVYPTYVFGKDAYGVVMSGGLQSFVEGLGSAGTSDPLHQISTVGTKIRGKAVILKQSALYRIESASSIWSN